MLGTSVYEIITPAELGKTNTHYDTGAKLIGIITPDDGTKLGDGKDETGIELIGTDTETLTIRFVVDGIVTLGGNAELGIDDGMIV